MQDGLQAQGTDVLTQQLPQQLGQQPQEQLLHQVPWHFSEQPSAPDPAWTQRLGFTALPQETRQDNSLAAYHCLLSEEAQRMLLHASPDGQQFQAKSFLRTPQHLLPLVEACKCLRGLKALDLSLNALSDSALPQLQHLMEAGAQLSSLDLSHNQLSSQAAAPLCSIIGHVSQPVLPNAPSQQTASTLDASHSSHLAAQGSGTIESHAEAAAGQDVSSTSHTTSVDVTHDSSSSSSSAASAIIQEDDQPQFGGSQSRLAGVASTSAPESTTGLVSC